MQHQIWTIGHSTRELPDFISLLADNRIRLLADVRTLPGSTKYPQYNQENLVKSLPQAGIDYVYFKGLGGLRKSHKNSKNTVWRNASFRAYADYMETDEFIKSVDALITAAKQKRVCLCCSEAVWWRCHRSMIADYLKCKGWKVNHIMGRGKTEEHPYTQPARIVGGQLFYGPARHG